VVNDEPLPRRPTRRAALRGVSESVGRQSHRREASVPKKIPAIDDIDAQTKAIGGALASALLTATEMPIHVCSPLSAIWPRSSSRSVSAKPNTSTRRAPRAGMDHRRCPAGVDQDP
jgi:hypothetical protein